MLSTEPNNKVRYTNVQALRGIAALLVCGFHFRFAIEHLSWTETLLGNGQIGVQLFFMISGFIMVHTTGRIKDDYSSNAGKFMLNRLIRIIPLYYLCTFFQIADDLNDGYLVTHGELLIKSLLFIAPMTSTAGPQYGFPPLEVGWTLNFEMFFYILFGVSILFGKIRYYFIYAVFLAFLLLIPVISGFGFSNSYEIYRDYSIPYMNMLTNPIWMHFIFGVTAGLLLPKIHLNKTAVRFSLPVTSFLFFLYYTNLTGIGWSPVYDLIFCGLMVTSFLLNDVHAEGYKLAKPFTTLGDESYSLYLLHPIILAYLSLFFIKAGLGDYTHNIYYFIFAIIITIIISFFFYKYIELKMTALLKNKIFRKIY